MKSENFMKFIKYYGKGRKFGLLLFSLLSIMAGLLEFLGIAIVYPFILLIIKPDAIANNNYYMMMSNTFHTHDYLANAFILGFLLIIIFVVKNLFMIFSMYLQTKFAGDWKYDINKRFMEYFLHAPYKKLIGTKPASKIYNLTFLTSQTLDLFIFRGINLATNLMIVSLILVLLLIKFPISAILTGIFVGFSMLFQNKLMKKKLANVSKNMINSSQANNSQIIENITYLKDIKISSAENYFYDLYDKAQLSYTDALIKTNFYNSIPPYIIEILIVISLLILAGIISAQNFQNTSGMIASYAVVVAAIFRIAPALNRIQTSINAINSSRGLVKLMNSEYELYEGLKPIRKLDLEKINLVFEKALTFKNVSFSYADKPTINNLDIEIKKGEFVGIIGSSGAGKTTIADIITGLLPIDSGEILLDGIKLSSADFWSLRKLIGYVPQEIHVLDESFKSNVCWGIEEDKINNERVIKALEEAGMSDVVSQYKEGMNAKVLIGENGLSQGQKQRLAIARAFYKNAPILILDEATSALDVETENSIVEVLNKKKGEKTIIAIAHRLSTLKNCDRLIYIKEGKLVDTGSFDELIAKHEDFAKLIKMSNIGTSQEP